MDSKHKKSAMKTDKKATKKASTKKIVNKSVAKTPPKKSAKKASTKKAVLTKVATKKSTKSAEKNTLVKSSPKKGIDNATTTKKSTTMTKADSMSGSISGNTFLFTGTLTGMQRKEAEALVKDKGGSILSGVSDKLNYLVVGEDAGSKLAKAKSIKTIKILSEKEFMSLFSKGGPNTVKANTLTENDARKFISDDDSIDLSVYNFIEENAAKVLSNYNGFELGLKGLTEISLNNAKHLAKSNTRLNLSGLLTIEKETAEALSKHKSDLFLDGLTSISEDVAKSLAKFEGTLSLGGLKSISDKVATALSAKNPKGKREDSLWLNGLNELTDFQAAALAKYKGNLSIQTIEDLRVKNKWKISPKKGKANKKNTGSRYTISLNGWGGEVIIGHISKSIADKLNKICGDDSLSDNIKDDDTLAELGLPPYSQIDDFLHIHAVSREHCSITVSDSSSKEILLEAEYTELYNDFCDYEMESTQEEYFDVSDRHNISYQSGERIVKGNLIYSFSGEKGNFFSFDISLNEGEDFDFTKLKFFVKEIVINNSSQAVFQGDFIYDVTYKGVPVTNTGGDTRGISFEAAIVEP